MKKIAIYILAPLLLLIGSCKNNNNGTKIVIYTRAPLGDSLFIRSIPYFEGKETVVNTAIIRDNHDSITLYLPKTDGEKLFKLLIPDTHFEITFINDTKLIRFHADCFADTCSIQGSPASNNLKKFESVQLNVAKKLHTFAKPIDSLKRAGQQTSKQFKTLMDEFNAEMKIYQDNYKAYEDTVKSPAAFMKLFNTVEFGNDYKGLKKFILSASKRFPHHKPIQELTRQTLATVRIYEQEFNVGDILPSITLPDKTGLPYSTSALKGQYYLIDFWSTICQPCMLFKNAEYFLYKKSPANNVQFVSVALNDNADEWKKFISQFKHPSIELIDTKMWQGPAVNTLLFDSIPFNFLVNPQGRIIAKAIKPDSLEKVISQLKR